VTAIKRPPDSTARARRLSPFERQKLLSEVARSGNKVLHSATMIALETAMRQGEILKLKWSDIDFDRGQISVQNTKNGSNRVIVMSSKLEAHLLDNAQSVGPLFVISASGLQQAFRKFVRQLQMHDLRFHDLRHEAISSFFEMGLSVPEVQLMSGHRTLDQLMRYSHAGIMAVKSKLRSSDEQNHG
jgi:integrase